MDLTIKSIIVHLPSPESVDRLMSLAIPLAKRTGSSLFGLHVMPRAEIYADATIGAGTDLIIMQQKQNRADSETIEKAFHDAVADSGVDTQWRTVDPVGHPTMDVAINLSRGADLVIASQFNEAIHPDAGYSPADLVIGAGRPVVLVPTAGTFTDIGSKVLITWSARRESARAASDCLPVLGPDPSVRVLEVKPDYGEDEVGMIDGETIAAGLARHGINADSLISQSTQHGIGEEILAQATDHGADLIVMGCYGHSRLRQFVFGGVTAHILKNMDRPILMSH